MTVQLQFTAGGVTAFGPFVGEDSAASVAVRSERWAAGSGVTLTALGVPLKRGQLLHTNIANVSVWSNGVEIPAYVEAMGAYGDGSARVLYVQTSQTLTNGVSVLGEIRLTGGFTQARRTLVDQSASWVNTPGQVNTAWLTGGLPAGAIVPTSPKHLCESMYASKYATPATAPVFAGSATTQALFESTYTTVAKTNTSFPQFGADYNAGQAFYARWAETADTQYLKVAISHYTKMRTELFIPGFWQFPEQRNCWDDILQGTLLLRDTISLSENLDKMINNQAYLNSEIYTATDSWSQTYFGARGKSKILGAINFLLAAYPEGLTKVTSGVTSQVWAERWLARSIEAPFWNGQVWGSPIDGPPYVPNGQVAVWQQMMMCRMIILLCDSLPASTLRTNALEACATNIAFCRTTYKQTSSYGRNIFAYYVDVGAPLPPVDDTNVDLNGFFPPMFAWRAWYKNSSVDADLARELYATCGLPQGAGGGPFIQAGQMKQWSENFHALPQTLYYLKLAGI